MHFDFGFRSSLLLIFFTHICVYCFLYIRRGITQESLPDKLMGCFLFFAALFLVSWMTGFAGWYDLQPYRDFLFYMPCVHGFLLGPLVYLYVKGITNFDYRLRKKDLYHFIPGLLYIAWSIVVVVTDKLVLKRYYLMNGETDPDFSTWYRYAWTISICIYLFLSIKYYRKYRKFIYLELSFADTASMLWLRNFLYAFSFITLLTVFLNIFSIFIKLEYWKVWYYYFSFSIIVYLISIEGFNNGKVPLRRLFFDPQLLLKYQQPALLSYTELQTEDALFEMLGEDEQEDLSERAKWQSKIDALMNREKLYQQPELTLTDLAVQLQTNNSTLSRALNQAFGMNFNDYINRFRVEEVKNKMADVQYANQTLMSMAYDAGFNSKSTFNRAFKKYTGFTPKDFLIQQNKGVKS